MNRFTHDNLLVKNYGKEFIIMGFILLKKSSIPPHFNSVSMEKEKSANDT